VFDAAGLCRLLLLGIWVEEVMPLLESATGVHYREDELLTAGERIWNLERLFNMRAGFSGADDTLPRRMLDEQMPEGPAQGQLCRLKEMLPEYYAIRGWDGRGVPTKERCNSLGLGAEKARARSAG
jgi:aldehyde:ferredoxin oxidoreductase